MTRSNVQWILSILIVGGSTVFSVHAMNLERRVLLGQAYFHSTINDSGSPVAGIGIGMPSPLRDGDFLNFGSMTPNNSETPRGELTMHFKVPVVVGPMIGSNKEPSEDGARIKKARIFRASDLSSSNDQGIEDYFGTIIYTVNPTKGTCVINRVEMNDLLIDQNLDTGANREFVLQELREKLNFYVKNEAERYEVALKD